MTGPATDGDFFSPPPLGEWNDMREAGTDVGRRRRVGTRRYIETVPRDRVVVQNITGSFLYGGRVLELTDSLLTTLDPENMWFVGERPNWGTKPIAVSLEPVPDDGMGWFQKRGLCEATVVINHVQHTRCDVIFTDDRLHSSWHGRCEIVRAESSGTGVRQCLIDIGDMHRGPFKVKINDPGGIVPAAGGSTGIGGADVYLNGVLTSPVSQMTVYYNWAAGGINCPDGTEAFAYWSDHENKYVLLQLAPII